MRRSARTALLLTGPVIASLLVAAPAQADPASPVVIDFPITYIQDVAIDGDHLYVQDGWSGSNKIYAQTLDFGSGTASERVNYGSGERIVAGDERVSWTELLGKKIRTRDVSGVETSVWADKAVPTSVTRGWAVANGTSLVNLTTGTATSLGYESAVLDGVLYQPGAGWATAPGTLVARDLETGSSSFITPPAGCTSVSAVQVAGSWLLLTCTTGTYVVDRTAAVAPFTIDPSLGEIRLGNGFVTVLSGTTLSWSTLAGGSLALSELATNVASSDVSRGIRPTIAWRDTSAGAHAALLPVTPSAIPAKPTDVSQAPSTPVLTATTTASSITVSWPAPSAAEKLSGYILTGGPGGRQILPAAATSHTFRQLEVGTQYTVRLQAQSAAGSSPVAQVTAVPRYPYPGFGVITSANYVEATKVLTVEWYHDWVWANEKATSFDVSIRGHAVRGLPADARTATISAGDIKDGDIVTVRAYGTSESTTWTLPVVSDHDSTPPETSFGLSPVILGTQLTTTVSAWDRKSGLKSIDIRLRYAVGPAKALGGWTYPAAWQGVSTDFEISRKVKPGATYCLSVRARDVKNNLSKWSISSCAAVALDDKALTKYGTWQTVRSENYFNGTAQKVKSSKASLSKTVRAERLFIVATTCKTCGKIGVNYGPRSFTHVVDLRSSETLHQQLIYVPGSEKFTGKIKIVKWGSTFATIDGLAVVAR